MDLRCPDSPPRARLRTSICTVLLVLLTCGIATAQAGKDLSPPPDLAAPPGDAARSASGLISKMLSAGEGTDKPAATDVVTVDYTGWASDGRMFDSSIARNKPSTFPLDRSLPGWRECVQLMTVGEKRRCWVPESLAYRGAS